AAAVDGKIYVIGGWNQTGKLSTVEEYDPTTDTWTRKADMPTARKGMATSVVNGKIYAFGGSTVVQAPPGLLTTVEEYDPATNTWTKKEDMPSKRFGAAAVAVDGKIYVIGGWAAGFHTSVVEMYDPATDTWQKRANVPRGLGNTGFASVDGKIYLFGGSADVVLSTTYEYDPVTDKWTQKANIPAPRLLLPASALDGKIYLIGGDTHGGGGPTTSVLVYDPATDTWTDGTEMQTARGSLATVVVDGKIYAIGGHTGITWGNIGTVFATVEEYTPEGLESTTTAVSPQGKLTTTWGEIKRR
ncbi:hypothetical protein IH992_24800, partial [Candidatus Poribacteria bacterium]|nr:hypothetical protein [Candidatus Poribacteria bacterium]